MKLVAKNKGELKKEKEKNCWRSHAKRKKKGERENKQ